MANARTLQTPKKTPSALNRSVAMSAEQEADMLTAVLRLCEPADLVEITDRIVLGDALDIAPLLPRKFVDLLILDPPYNLTKQFGNVAHSRRNPAEYSEWFAVMLEAVAPALKSTASVYVCADWRTSAEIYAELAGRFVVRNRITWEREKGRGAGANWKNCSEDIWFCTAGDEYQFDVDAVRLKRRVLAPYRDASGSPKDWQAESDGAYRLTSPSNFWSDITVPFWSMPENTCHPTQKPEKLIAKLLLASSRPGDFVLDPFLGSGTTSVVAQKLARSFLGIELQPHYAAVAQLRLDRAREDARIQGYSDGVFWERNSEPKSTRRAALAQPPLRL